METIYRKDIDDRVAGIVWHHLVFHIYWLYSQRNVAEGMPFSNPEAEHIAITEESLVSIPEFVGKIASRAANGGVTLEDIHPETGDPNAIMEDINRFFVSAKERAGKVTGYFCADQFIQYMGYGYIAIPTLIDLERGRAFIIIFIWPSPNKKRWQITGYA